MRHDDTLFRDGWQTAGPYRLYVRSSARPTLPPHPPIVLLHGFLVSGRYMMPTARLLADDYHVLVPDLPGFGQSTKPPNALPLDRLAHMLALWMRSLQLDEAVFLGNSFGCQVIVELALRHPTCVSKAILLGPTVDPRARSLPRLSFRLLLDVAELVPMAPILIRDLADAGIAQTWQTLSSMLGDRIEDKLPHIRVPTLVVRGEKDSVAPQAWTEEASRLLPAGQLAVVPEGRHAANCSSPEALVATIRPFLKR